MLNKPTPNDGTMLDPDLARPRLKAGVVPPQTGLFLRVQEGEPGGCIFTLSAGGVYLIGRDGADIVLPDQKISRKHAEVALYGPQKYFVRDLASTNGTFINGRRLRDRHELAHEDLLRVGDTVLQFAVVDDSIRLADARV